MFFTILKNELINYHQDQLIIGRDFNCTLDFTMDRIGGEPHSKSSHSLNNVITHLDLLDAWKVKHPQSRQYTWVSVANNRVSAAILDISQNLSSRLIHSNINPFGFNDHHFVSIDLVSAPGDRVKSLWFFNKLLLYRIFCQNFELFWQQ